ncbi:hypothetical protein AAFF_G00241360 [Aldrovandia affinis]|uniref:Uncharacterized protein n=1 Tax=Aldrovandia affinis TaxID=143900 RepID=A0AAD7SUW3_9TELE|nr:hypothetical protein AAFF_G00241360 [Aldrovandia affinis]
MRPRAPPRPLPRPGRTAWMWWALTVGWLAGSAWSSTPESDSATPDQALGTPSTSSSSSSSASFSLHGPVGRLHPAPVSIYRSPASLRGGHGAELPIESPSSPAIDAVKRRACCPNITCLLSERDLKGRLACRCHGGASSSAILRYHIRVRRSGAQAGSTALCCWWQWPFPPPNTIKRESGCLEQGIIALPVPPTSCCIRRIRHSFRASRYSKCSGAVPSLRALCS